MIELFTLIVFILTCYGLSNMVIYSNGPGDMFVKWRSFTNRINTKFGELFSCMMCLPFWVGVLFSLIDLFVITGAVFTPYNILLYTQASGFFKTLLILSMDGFLSSGSTWIVHNIEEYFELKQ